MKHVINYELITPQVSGEFVVCEFHLDLEEDVFLPLNEKYIDWMEVVGMTRDTFLTSCCAITAGYCDLVINDELVARATLQGTVPLFRSNLHLLSSTYKDPQSHWAFNLPSADKFPRWRFTYEIDTTNTVQYQVVDTRTMMLNLNYADGHYFPIQTSMYVSFIPTIQDVLNIDADDFKLSESDYYVMVKKESQMGKTLEDEGRKMLDYDTSFYV